MQDDGNGTAGRRPIERVFASVALVGIAALFVLADRGAISTTWTGIFHDTDDAMRLVEVRDFLAGQGWFDLHQYRLDPPAEVPMHWSRFVDAPIAGLILFFRLFFEAATAEKLAMIVWPPLALAPMLLGLRALASRLGGEGAMLPAIYLAVTTGPVVAQFVPGRIDHHNVQIGLTVWLLATVAGPASGRRGIAAGLIVAAMLAVGLETLPFVLIVAAAIALRFVVLGDRERFAAGFGAALALAVPAIAVATLPPSEWFRPACDALSISYVALAVVGGAGLFAAAVRPAERWTVRALWLLPVAVAAIVAFAAPSSRCLAGPFAEVTPEVRRLWLDQVTEVQPWAMFTKVHPVDGWIALLSPILGAIAAAILVADRRARGGLGLAVLVASAAAATVIGLMQIRTIVYADLLSNLLVAAAIGVIAERVRAAGGSVVVAVLAGTVLTSPSLATALVVKLAPAAWTAGASSTTAAAGTAGGSTATACMDVGHYRALAALSPGLVAADVNLGPSILAATPHAVVTAPYHRMQRGIVDADRMLNAPPAEALAAIDRRGVAWLVHCAGANGPEPEGEAFAQSLIGRLLSGERLPRFEEVAGDPAVRVFRVLPKPAN